MTDLQFVDQHNMVACLDRTYGNAEFHQIVDFLTSSMIHYALTQTHAKVDGKIMVISESSVRSDLLFNDEDACLDRTDGNAKFHQIVDFLTSSTIHYALTQTHAKVDGKIMVISESSVRSDLLFNDEDGITCLSNDENFENLALMGYERISTKLTFQKAFFSHQRKNLDHTSKKFLMYPIFLQLFLNNQIALKEPFNDVYVTPAHTKKVLTNMKRQNKDFFGTVTLLFDTMLVPPVVEGEGLGQPSVPQRSSSTALPKHDLDDVGDRAVYTGEDDRVVRAAITVAGLKVEQKSGNINKTRPMTTLDEPSPQGTGSGSGHRRHVITLGDTDAQTRFKTASKQSYDPPLSEVNTSGSREDSMEHQDDFMDFVPPTPHDSPGRPNINELMNICTQFSNRVLALEQFKTAQDLVIKKLQKKVKRLEKKQRARTPGMKLFKIGTSKKKTLDKENVSKQRRDESNKTEELNLADKGSGDTKVFDYTTAAEKGVNAAEPVSTAGDAVNAASVILDGRPNINELMNICTQFSNRVLALEQFKTAQDLVIKKLQKKVKRLEKKQRARTPGMKLFKIGTSKKKTLDKENVSKQGRDESNKIEELNLDDKGSGDTKVFNYTTAAEKGVNAAEPVSTAGDAVNAVSVILDVSVVGPSTSTAGF
nr:hypothetical protein [Tanacetum cinerariifolium]